MAGLTEPERHGRGAEPLGYHHPDEHVEPAVDAVQRIALGHAHVLQHEPACTASPHAHEPVYVFALNAVRPRHHECGHALVGRGVRVGCRIDQEPVSTFSAHDEALLAVYDPVAAVFCGIRCGAEKVRPAPRLGEPFRCKGLPLEERDHYFLLELVIAEERDGLAHDVRAHPPQARERIAGNADLLGHDGVINPAQAPAAQLLGQPDPQQVPPARLLKIFVGELHLLGIHVEDELLGHPLGEGPGLVSQFLLCIGHDIVEHVFAPPI